jgi:hypothetical protein
MAAELRQDVYSIQITEEEAAREKLRSLGNRKAISSDDFNFDSSKSQEIE